MNHNHAPLVVQSIRQRKVPSNETCCQRLSSNEARPQASEGTNNADSLRDKTSEYSLALDDSATETDCPIRRICISKIQKSDFNQICRVGYYGATRLLEWLRSARSELHWSTAVQSIDDEHTANNREDWNKSDDQMGEHPSCLNSLIDAWPGLMPHIREAILTLVDAAKLVEAGLSSHEAVKCSVPDCMGCKHE